MLYLKNFKSGDDQWKKKTIIFVLSILSFCIYISFEVFSIIKKTHESMFVIIGLLGFPLLFIIFCLANDEKKLKYANSMITVILLIFLWILTIVMLILIWVAILKRVEFFTQNGI